MRPLTSTFLALAALMGASLSAAPAAAQAGAGLATEATHAVIMDFATGQVLFSKDADVPMPPASMSKLMTMLVVFDRIKQGSLSLDDEFIVSEDAWRRGGFASGSATMCLQPRERVRVGDLIRGVIVLSGNDASIVLAEGLSGSEAAFAEEMQVRGEEIGLTAASFRNATGWPDPEHRVSALDLARIARRLIADHPDLYQIYAEREFGWCTESPDNRYNRNPLLGTFDGADGLKTGHTSESGYGLVASAARGEERRIVVFNGMPTNAARAREAQRLLTAAFRDFRVHDVFAAGDTVADAPVFMGEAARVPLIVQEPVTVAYHRRAAGDVSARIDLDAGLKAPITAGDPVGVLTVEVPGAEPITRTVTAGADVARLGMRGRAVAALVHLIRSQGG